MYTVLRKNSKEKGYKPEDYWQLRKESKHSIKEYVERVYDFEPYYKGSSGKGT